MIRLTPILVACALFTLSFAAACGGDDSHDGSAGTYAGAGGIAGTLGGSGTSGIGGASGNAGASGNTSTAGAGGAGARGGAGGSGASGGAGGMGNNMMGMMVCPATKPTDGATCQPGRGNCEIGADVCDCLRGSSTWLCWNPATDCPATAPADDDACPTIGVQCEFDDGDCRCSDQGWDCEGGNNNQDEDGGV
jgi:hypothetical protein